MPTTTTAPIKYDPSVRQFRYLDTGQLASREAVAYQTAKFIKGKQKELVELADKIYANPSDIAIQRQMAGILKDIHIANASIASKGSDKLYLKDYGIVARELKNQYGLSDNYPQQYGVQFLFQDVLTGRTSLARLRERLEMYAKSGKASYFLIEIEKASDSGMTEAIRKLGFGEHCPQCNAYSRLGWQDIRDIIPPTKACSCFTNCKCSLQFRVRP